jgi:hypothetical protein
MLCTHGFPILTSVGFSFIVVQMIFFVYSLLILQGSSRNANGHILEKREKFFICLYMQKSFFYTSGHHLHFIGIHRQICGTAAGKNCCLILETGKPFSGFILI